MERLWKAWTVVLEMLVDRKYVIPSDYFVSYDDFIEWVGDKENEARKTMYFTSNGTGKNPIAVFWKELLGTSDVLDVVETIKSENIKHALVIHNNKVTPYAATALRLLRVQKIIIEVFTEDELQFNITRHEYVPKHIICSAETKQKVFDTYAIDATKMIKILVTDPVLRYYGATKGQLIKIVRPSDSIPEIEIPSPVDPNKKEKKILYDVTYKIVA